MEDDWLPRKRIETYEDVMRRRVMFNFLHDAAIIGLYASFTIVPILVCVAMAMR